MWILSSHTYYFKDAFSGGKQLSNEIGALVLSEKVFHFRGLLHSIFRSIKIYLLIFIIQGVVLDG